MFIDLFILDDGLKFQSKMTISYTKIYLISLVRRDTILFFLHYFKSQKMPVKQTHESVIVLLLQ